MKFKKDLPYILIGLLLLCVVFWRRFLPGYLYNGDTGLLLGENFTSYYHAYLWIANSRFGYPLTEIPRILINGFVGTLGHLGFERNGSIIRLFFLLPYCAFGYLGTYYLAGLYTTKKHFRIIAGLLYVINTPVILSLSMGHLHQIVPLGVFPWIVLFAERFLQTKKYYQLYYILILLFISSVYEFRFAYITFLTILFMLVFGVVRKKITLHNVLFSSIILGGGFIIVNLYWIIPFLNNGAGDVSQLLSRGPFGNGYRNILNGIGQFHTYRNGGLPKIFVKQPIPLQFFILPISAVIGLYTIKNKSILGYYILLLLGILLVKQAGYPFRRLYEWIYNTLPGFNMFREGSRFFQLITLAYAIIIPTVLDSLYQKSTRSTLLKRGYYCLLGGVYIYLCAIAYPIIFGVNTTFFQPKFPDHEYTHINNFINTQNESFKIMYIPGAGQMVFTNTHPGVSFIESINNVYTGTDTLSGSSIISMTGFDTYLDNSGIKYVVLNKEKKGTDNPYYRYQPREDYKKELLINKHLMPVAISGSDATMIFQNTGYKALFHGTSKIEFQFINPVTYYFTTTIPENITTINFLQEYDKKRGVYPCIQGINNDCKNNTVVDKLFSMRQPSLFDKNHVKISPLGNQRTIDRATILTHFPKESYTINNDGSITVHMMLYFRPQSRFYIGALLSTMSLVILFGLIIHYKLGGNKKIYPHTNLDE